MADKAGRRTHKRPCRQISGGLDDGHERAAVADYGHYFLGSIIVSDKQGQKFIIDGQQRLTTLTLLLIFIQHQLADPEQKGQVADLIFSQRFGKRFFNLDIPERMPCMEALYSGETVDSSDQQESIANISARSRTSENSSQRSSRVPRSPTSLTG